MPATRPFWRRFCGLAMERVGRVALSARGLRPRVRDNRLQIQVPCHQHDELARIPVLVTRRGELVFGGAGVVGGPPIDDRLRHEEPRVENIERTDDPRKVLAQRESKRFEIRRAARFGDAPP